MPRHDYDYADDAAQSAYEAGHSGGMATDSLAMQLRQQQMMQQLL